MERTQGSMFPRAALGYDLVARWATWRRSGVAGGGHEGRTEMEGTAEGAMSESPYVVSYKLMVGVPNSGRNAMTRSRPRAACSAGGRWVLGAGRWWMLGGGARGGGNGGCKGEGCETPPRRGGASIGGGRMGRAGRVGGEGRSFNRIAHAPVGARRTMKMGSSAGGDGRTGNGPPRGSGGRQDAGGPRLRPSALGGG